jgi:ubiquitin-conjugating enzyme E2 T
MDLEAVIVGPPDSPFEKGFFKLKIHLPERYPFEPPQGEF